MAYEEKYDNKELNERCASCGTHSYKKCDECLRSIISILSERTSSLQEKIKIREDLRRKEFQYAEEKIKENGELRRLLKKDAFKENMMGVLGFMEISDKQEQELTLLRKEVKDLKYMNTELKKFLVEETELNKKLTKEKD